MAPFFIIAAIMSLIDVLLMIGAWHWYRRPSLVFFLLAWGCFCLLTAHHLFSYCLLYDIFNSNASWYSCAIH